MIRNTGAAFGGALTRWVEHTEYLIKVRHAAHKLMVKHGMPPRQLIPRLVREAKMVPRPGALELLKSLEQRTPHRASNRRRTGTRLGLVGLLLTRAGPALHRQRAGPHRLRRP